MPVLTVEPPDGFDELPEGGFCELPEEGFCEWSEGGAEEGLFASSVVLLFELSLFGVFGVCEMAMVVVKGEMTLSDSIDGEVISWLSV